MDRAEIDRFVDRLRDNRLAVAQVKDSYDRRLNDLRIARGVIIAEAQVAGLHGHVLEDIEQTRIRLSSLYQHAEVKNDGVV